ncbi:hypothetical protein ABS71_18485 [bacterium SCN 62-11]|nr:MAG: hypothetical protein ABS71_18485 [bacterium SCN 62-11]
MDSKLRLKDIDPADYKGLPKDDDVVKALTQKELDRITTRCDGCIASHVEAAVKLGVTKEEISEALGVAIALNAGAALVYSARTLDCYEQSTAPASQAAE